MSDCVARITTVAYGGTVRVATVHVTQRGYSLYEGETPREDALIASSDDPVRLIRLAAGLEGNGHE